MLHPFFHNLTHGLRTVNIGFLREISHTVARTPYDVTLVVRVYTCNDFHQCRFSRSVQTDNADFRSVEETEINVFENGFVSLSDGFGQTHH